MYKRLEPKRGSAGLYVLMLIAAVGCMAVGLKMCSSPGLSERDEHLAAGDTLNMAIEVSPVGVTMSGDTLSGVYYDLLREKVGSALPLRFHPITRLSDALAGLDEGRYQLVVADIPATAELKSRYCFVNPGDVDRQVLVQLADSTGAVEVATQTDLGHKHVAVPVGSPFIARLRALSHEIGDTIFVDEDPSYSSEQLVILTALGEVPRAVVSEGVARRLLHRYPRLDASVPVSFRQFQGWAMTDSVMRDSIQALIGE